MVAPRLVTYEPSPRRARWWGRYIFDKKKKLYLGNVRCCLTSTCVLCVNFFQTTYIPHFIPNYDGFCEPTGLTEKIVRSAAK